MDNGNINGNHIRAICPVSRGRKHFCMICCIGTQTKILFRLVKIISMNHMIDLDQIFAGVIIIEFTVSKLFYHIVARDIVSVTVN